MREMLLKPNAFFLKEEPRSITLVKELRDQDADFVDEKVIRTRVFEHFRDTYNLTGKKKMTTKFVWKLEGLFLGRRLNKVI